MNKLIKQAFTLIELLVVIAIIGILSGLIVVTMNGVTNSANIAKSQVFSNSLRNALMMNLVSEWKFDQINVPAANQTPDSWGTNTGTLNGAGGSQNLPQLQTTGCMFGNCLQFDGTDDYVDCGNGANLQITSAITISAWAYIDPAGGMNGTYGYVVAKTEGNPATGGYSLWFDDRGGSTINSIRSYGIASDTTLFDLIAQNAIPVAGWYYLVATYNKDDIAPQAKLYINAVQRHTYTFSKAMKSDLFTVKIGDVDGTQPNFAGKIDDVRIFNAAMPTSQIKELYYSGLNNLLSSHSITNEEYLSKINNITSK